NEVILVAVHNEERRITLCYVRERTGLKSLFLVFLNWSTKERGNRVLRSVARRNQTREVGGPEPVANSLHFARLIGVGSAGAELFRISGSPEKGNEVTARGSTPDTDMIAIQPILLGLGPQPADRRLAILDLRGELRMLTEPVIDAGHRKSLRHQ